MRPFEPGFVVVFGTLLTLHCIASVGRASPGLQNLLLLGGSILVVGAAHPWFALVLVAVGTGQYYAARAIAAATSGRWAILLGAVVLNIGLLEAFSTQNLWLPMPLGLSF